MKSSNVAASVVRVHSGSWDTWSVGDFERVSGMEPQTMLITS